MRQPISILAKHGGGGDLGNRWRKDIVTWHSDYKRVFHVLPTTFILEFRQKGVTRPITFTSIGTIFLLPFMYLFLYLFFDEQEWKTVLHWKLYAAP
jgi:hypothetical protein